jgi:hypothetical protein
MKNESAPLSRHSNAAQRLRNLMSPTVSEQELYVLDFQKSEIYEGGAMLLTILAFPEELGEDKNEELIRSLCAMALQHKYLAAPEDQTPVTAKPQYLFRPTQLINREVKSVHKKFQDRLNAGRLITPFLEEAAGHPVRLPTGVSRLSINQMIEFILPTSSQSEASNLATRIWRPSRRVIHLGAAAATVLQQRQAQQPEIPFETLLFDEQLIRAIVSLAQGYADAIAAWPRFPVSAASLVRVVCK